MRPHRLRMLVPVLVGVFALYPFPNLKNTHAEGDKQGSVRFRWAFGAMTGPEGGRRLVAVTRKRRLKTGDQLKMLIELQKECFVYLIYRTRKDELQMLFPYDDQRFDKNYQLFKKYYIPPNDMWFRLDENVGQETFYLLASDRRLLEIEMLFKKYMPAKGAKKLGLARRILSEIRKLKRRHRKLVTAAERPVSIGGTVRGIRKDKKRTFPDIDPIAAVVSAASFYSRTFTIEHQ